MTALKIVFFTLVVMGWFALAWALLFKDNSKGIAYDPSGTPIKRDVVDAVRIASKKTKVPKAYLLALLWQESKLGKDIGVPGKALTDAPYPEQAKPIVHWVAKEHNYTAETLRGSIGGGGMGIAQIIPTTFAPIAGITVRGGIAFYDRKRDRISKALKKEGPPDPYNVYDSVMAGALKLEEDYQHFHRKGYHSTAWSLAFGAYLAGRGGASGEEGVTHANAVIDHLNTWAIEAANNI